MQKLVRWFDSLTLALPIFTLLLIAFTLWLSLNRRRTLVRMMFGVVLLFVILRRGVLHFEGELVNRANNAAVAQSVLGTVLHGFFTLTAWILGIAAVLLVIGLLAGPYRWAVWLRRQVARGFHAVAQLANRERRATAVAWMSAHAEPLQLVGAAVAVILFLLVSISWVSFLVIGILLAAYEVFLARIKPHDTEGPVGPPPTSGVGVGDPLPH
jgi:hypothetical protein